YGWGDNHNGEVGNGSESTTPVYTPTLVTLPAGVSITSLAAEPGAPAVVGLSSSGQVYAWGDDSFGVAGDGSNTGNLDAPTLVPMPAGVTITAVAAEHYTVLALASAGQVYGWGSNQNGEIGSVAPGDRLVPTLTALPAGFQAVAIAGGTDFGYALSATGS